MTENDKKFGSVIVDVFLYLFFVAMLGVYLWSFVGISDGISGSFLGNGELVYGIEAYVINLTWLSLFVLLIPVIPAAVIYDTVILAVKLKRRTLKAYELIPIVLTYLMSAVSLMLTLPDLL